MKIKNIITIDGDPEGVLFIKKYLAKDGIEFTLTRIIPEPNMSEVMLLDWRRANWGCKFDVQCCNWIDENVVAFLTDWQPCSPCIKALSKKFSEYGFKIYYSDESGRISGFIKYNNGELINRWSPSYLGDYYKRYARMIWTESILQDVPEWFLRV